MRRHRQLWTALLLGLLLPFCAQPGDQTNPPAPNSGAIGQAFESASAEAGVPLPLLMAIGYVETRWTVPAAQDGVVPEAVPGYGIMHLTDASSDDKVQQGADILGVNASQVRTDTATNIRAAAALLRLDAEQTFGSAQAADDADLDAWRDVVLQWSGIDDPDLAMGYADDVYQVMRNGAGKLLDDGEDLQIEPQQVSAPGATSTAGLGNGSAALSSDYAGAARVYPASSANYTAGRQGPVDMVIIHDTEGSYWSAIYWFANSAAQASAHYVVNRASGEITQSVMERDTAWHCGNWPYNVRSVGIEHEGFYNHGGYTEAQYQESAKLSCDIARRHGIPIDRRHFIGHSEVPDPNNPGQFGGAGHHRDPGPYWDWNHYLDLVRAACNGQPIGGTTGGTTGGGATCPEGNGIYCGGDGIGGKQGTLYQCTDGKLTVKQVCSGECKYEPAGVPDQCGPAPVRTATVQGIVYHAPDTHARIAGASVRLSDGTTATTNKYGFYKVTVKAGRYTVTASAAGYQDGQVVRSAPAGSTVSADIGLRPAAEAHSGTLSGFVFAEGNPSQRVAGARVSVQGGPSATTDALGRFQFSLAAGRYTVTASKSGYVSATAVRLVHAGQTTTLGLGLSKPGEQVSLVGVVYAAPNDKNRISGAEVTLNDGQSQTTGADGYFSFTVTPGTWRVSVRAAGYLPGLRVRQTVPGVAKTWASVGLQKEPPSGTLEGVIYAAPNTADRIAGATVSAGGQSATTDARGIYKLTLPSGDYAVQASASGYLPRSIHRHVGARATIWGSIGLTKSNSSGGGGSFNDRPVLVSPIDGATASSNPTFQWEGIGPAQQGGYTYHLFVGSEDDVTRPQQEFTYVSKDAQVSATFGLSLSAGHYAWGVYAVRDSDQAQGPVSDLGAFVVP